MPIGKNSIKRVKNNGYSNVKTSAPDMENSNVIANPAEEVLEKLVKPVEEKTAKTAAKKVVAKKTTAKKTACKACGKAKTEKDDFSRVSVGEDLPYYLL